MIGTDTVDVDMILNTVVIVLPNSLRFGNVVFVSIGRICEVVCDDMACEVVCEVVDVACGEVRICEVVCVACGEVRICEVVCEVVDVACVVVSSVVEIISPVDEVCCCSVVSMSRSYDVLLLSID